MWDIPADGHCMYRSLSHQMSGALSYPDLRQRAANYLRRHASRFRPFADLTDYEDDEHGDQDAAWERYLRDVSDSATWGGHLELLALSEVLRRPVEVYAVGNAPQPLVVRPEGEGEGGEPIRMCYLRHAYDLGEHYNSVVVAQVADLDDDDDDDEEEEEDDEEEEGVD